MATLDDDIFNPQVARVRARLEAVGVDTSGFSNKDLLLRLAEDSRNKGGLDYVEDQFGSGFKNQYLDVINAPEPGREGFFGGIKEIPEGIGKGYEGLKSTALGGLGLAAGTLGFEEAEASLMQSASEAQERASKYNPSVARASDVRWDNIGEVARFLAGGFGEALPSTVEAAGSFALGAGVGGLAGRQVVKSRLRETLKNVIKRNADEGVDQAIKRTFSMAGMQLGLGVSSIGLGVGEIYTELYPYTQLSPEDDEYVSPEKAKSLSIGFGTLAGSLDMMSAALQLNKILGIGEEASERYLKRLLYNLPEGVFVEGATEAAQEFINIAAEKYAKGRELTISDDELDRMFDAGVLGAIGGTQFSAAGAIRFGDKKKDGTELLGQQEQDEFSPDETIPDDFKQMDELDNDALNEIETEQDEDAFPFKQGDPVVFKAGDGFKNGTVKNIKGSTAQVERTISQNGNEITIVDDVPVDELFTGKFVPPEEEFNFQEEEEEVATDDDAEPEAVVTEQFKYGDQEITIQPEERSVLEKAIKSYEESASKKNGVSSQSKSPKKDFLAVTGLSKSKKDMEVFEKLKKLGILNSEGQYNQTTQRDLEIEKQEYKEQVQKNKDQVTRLFTQKNPDGSRTRLPDLTGKQIKVEAIKDPFVITSYDPETGEMTAEYAAVNKRTKNLDSNKIRITSKGAFRDVDNMYLGRVYPTSQKKGKMRGKGTEYIAYEAGTVDLDGEFSGDGIFVENDPGGQIGALGGIFDIGDQKSVILQDPKVYDMKGAIPSEDDFYTARRSIATGNDGVIFENVGPAKNRIIYTGESSNVFNTREEETRNALTELGYTEDEIDSVFTTSPEQVLGETQGQLVSKINRIVGNYQFVKDSPFVGDQITRDELIQDATTEELEAVNNNALVWALGKRTDVFSPTRTITPSQVVRENNLGELVEWSEDTTYEYEGSKKYSYSEINATSPENFEELLHRRDTKGQIKKIFVNRKGEGGGYLTFQTIEPGKSFLLGGVRYNVPQPESPFVQLFSQGLDDLGVDIEGVYRGDPPIVDNKDEGRILAILEVVTPQPRDGLDNEQLRVVDINRYNKFYDSLAGKGNAGKYVDSPETNMSPGDAFQMKGYIKLFFPKSKVDVMFPDMKAFIADPSVSSVINSYNAEDGFVPKYPTIPETEGGYSRALLAWRVASKLKKGRKNAESRASKLIDLKNKLTGNKKEEVRDPTGQIADALAAAGKNFDNQGTSVIALLSDLLDVRFNLNESDRNAIDKTSQKGERLGEVLLASLPEVSGQMPYASETALKNVLNNAAVFGKIGDALLYKLFKDHPRHKKTIDNLSEQLFAGQEIDQAELEALALEMYEELAVNKVIVPYNGEPRRLAEILERDTLKVDYDAAVEEKTIKKRKTGEFVFPAVVSAPNDPSQSSIIRRTKEMLRAVPQLRGQNIETISAQQQLLLNIADNTAEGSQIEAVVLQVLIDTFQIPSLNYKNFGEVKLPAENVPLNEGDFVKQVEQMLKDITSFIPFQELVLDSKINLNDGLAQFRQKVHDIWGMPFDGEESVNADKVDSGSVESLAAYLKEQFYNEPKDRGDEPVVLSHMSQFPKGMVDMTTGREMTHPITPINEEQLEADLPRRRSYTRSVAVPEEHPMITLGMTEQLSNARLGMERFMQSRKRIRVAQPLSPEMGPHLKAPTWKTRNFTARSAIKRVLEMEKVNKATKYWARALERNPDLIKGMVVQFVDWADFRQYASVQEDQISSAVYLPGQNKILVSDLFYDNPSITPEEQLASILVHEVIHSPTKLALDIGFAQANSLPIPGKIESADAEVLGRIYTSLNDVLLPELREKISNTDYVHGLSSVDEMLSELGSNPAFRNLLSATTLSAQTRKRLGISKSWIKTAWDYIKAVFARIFGLETDSETLKYANEQLDKILDTAQRLTPQRIAINHANVRGVGNLNILAGVSGMSNLPGDLAVIDWFDGTKRTVLNPKNLKIKRNIFWNGKIQEVYDLDRMQSGTKEELANARIAPDSDGMVTLQLADVVEWDELFIAYPNLRNAKIKIDPLDKDSRGYVVRDEILSGENTIYFGGELHNNLLGSKLSDIPEFSQNIKQDVFNHIKLASHQRVAMQTTRTLVHEIQHLIDVAEGNPAGFSPGMFRNNWDELGKTKIYNKFLKVIGADPKNVSPKLAHWYGMVIHYKSILEEAMTSDPLLNRRIAITKLVDQINRLSVILGTGTEFTESNMFQAYQAKSGEVTSRVSEELLEQSFKRPYTYSSIDGSVVEYVDSAYDRELQDWKESQDKGVNTIHPALRMAGRAAQTAWAIDTSTFKIIEDALESAALRSASSKDFDGYSKYRDLAELFGKNAVHILSTFSSYSTQQDIPQPDASERVFQEGDVAAVNEVITLLAKTYNNLFAKGMVTQTPEEFIKAYAPGKIGSKKYYSRISKGIENPGSIRIGDQGRNQVTRVHASNEAIDLISQVLRGRKQKTKGVLDRLDDAEAGIRNAEELIEQFNEQFKDVIKKGLASPEDVARGMLVYMKKMTMEEIQKLAIKVGKPIRKTAMTMDGVKIKQVENVLSKLVDNDVDVEKLKEQDINNAIEELDIDGFSGQSPEDKYRRVALIKAIRTQKDTGMFLYRLAKDKLGEGTAKDRNNLIKDIQNVLTAKDETELSSVEYLSGFNKRLDTLKKRKLQQITTEQVLKDSIKERDMLKEFYAEINPRYKRLRAAMGELEPTDIGDGKPITVMRLVRDEEGTPIGGYEKQTLTIRYDKNGAIDNPDFNKAISETLHFARDPININKYGNQPWFKNMARTAQAALMDPTNGLKDKYFTQRKHWHLGSLESVGQAMGRMGPSGKKIAGMITQVIARTRDLQSKVKAYAQSANRGFVRAQKELGKTGPEMYSEVWQDIAFWFDNHPEYFGQEDKAFTEMWKWLREERPMHLEGVQDMNKARDAIKFWIQKEMEARQYMRYVNEEILGNRIRDDEVTVQSDIDGRNMEFYRRPIDLGFATWSRTLNNDAVSAVVMMMRTTMSEKGNTDANRQAMLAELAAASEEQDINQVMEKLDALYGDDQVVKDFVEPFILSGVRRSAFTGPDDTPVGNSQFASSWKKSGGEMIAFLDDIFDRFADVDELDPDEAEAKRFEWYNSFAKQLHARYKRLVSADNQIASQSHDILKSSEALKNTPRSLDSRQIESKLPKQFFYYDIHDEVSTQIRLAMMVATSVFGRNGAQVNDVGQSFYDKMGGRSATFNKIMTEATKRVHNAPLMKYSGAERKKAYAILENQYNEKNGKLAFERLYSDAVTYREFTKVFDQLGQYYGKGNMTGAYGDANVLLELLGTQSLMVLDNPKSSFWQTLALGEFPMAFRGLNRMSGKATGAALANLFDQSFGGIVEAMNYNLPKTSRIARALNNTHFRTAEMDQGLAEHLTMVGPNGEMVNGDRANSFKKGIRRVKNFIAHSRRLNPDGTRQSFDAMTMFTGLFPWANGIINHSVGVGTATAYEAEILRIAKHIQDQGMDIFDPKEFTAEELGMTDSKTAEMIIGERDGWNNMNSLLLENGTSSMSRLAYDYLQRRALDSDAPVLDKDTILMMNQVGMANVSGEGFNAKIPALYNNGLMRYAGIFLGWPIWKMAQTNRFIEREAGDELGTYMAFLKYLGLVSAVYMPLGLSAAFLVDWYDEEVIGKPNNLPPLTPWAMTPVFGPMFALSNEESTIYALTSRLARAGNIYGMGLELANSMFASGDPYGAAREFSLDSRLFMFNTFRNIRDALGTWYHQGEADYGNVIRPMLYGLGLGSVIQQMDVVTNLLEIDSEERRVADYLTARNLIKKSAWVMGLQLKPPAKGYGKPSPVSVNLRQMERAAYANDKGEFSKQYSEAIEAAREYITENDISKTPEQYVHERFRQRNIKYGITQGVIGESDWQRILDMQDADDRMMLEKYVELHKYYLNQIGGVPQSRAPNMNQLRRMALLGIPIR